MLGRKCVLGGAEERCMLRPERPAWQISVGHVGRIVMAVPLAGVAALIVWKLSIWRLISHKPGIVAFLVTFVLFSVVLYFLLEWLIWEGPDETAQQVPTASKEIRRKTKHVFDMF